jgi:hypothetical protein
LLQRLLLMIPMKQPRFDFFLFFLVIWRFCQGASSGSHSASASASSRTLQVWYRCFEIFRLIVKNFIWTLN